MNVRQLEVFWAVMRTGSVTGAAKLLCVSQPAISKALRHTEAQLSVPLFDRRGGKLFPTEKATSIYAFAESIFKTMDELKQAVFDIRDSGSGRVQIATTPTIAESMLSKPIATLLSRYPRMDISLKLLPAAQIINRVALRQADLGVMYGPCDDPSVAMRELCRVKVVCAVHQTHPLAAKNVISPGDLLGERLISYHRYTPWGNAVWQPLQDEGFSAGRVIECNHASAAFALVQENAGIAVLPAVPSDSLSYADVRVKRLSLDIDFVTLVLLPTSGVVARPTELLLECVNKHFRQQIGAPARALSA